MSGITGIFHFDGRPVNPEILKQMTDVASHRGPDGSGYWCAGPVGLGHRMFHTTPESLHERQPLTDDEFLLCLTFDGRIDNREELKRSLSSTDFRLRTDTDAEIVLQAYRCWAEGCAQKLIGDFAFAIWDGRRRQLYCVRDCLYMKPFYYYSNEHTFLFASEIRQLLENSEVRRQPNEGMIGEMLTGTVWNREETLWNGISRLPSAHYLIVNHDGIRRVRYWDIDPGYSIRYQSDQEYRDHFLDVVSESVRCRMRSYGPVGAHLSGGLDSSSVVGITQQLIRQNKMKGDGFRTFSWVFDGLECDESDYIREVIKHWSLDSHTWSPQISDISFYRQRARETLDFPDYPNASMIHAYHALIRELGYRVVLTGEGGDEWFAGGLDDALEVFLDSGLSSSTLETLREGSLKRVAGLFNSVGKYYLKPWLPQVLLTAIRNNHPPKVPSWIDKEFAKRINLRDRMNTHSTDGPFARARTADADRAVLYGTVNAHWAAHAFEIMDREDARVGVEARNPFMDRRIVELMFAFPHRQRQRGKVAKTILREAMNGSLPERVRNRLGKADFMHFFVDALRLVGQDFERSSSLMQGWLQTSEVKRMHRELLDCYTPNSTNQPVDGWRVWMIYALGLWLDEAVTSTNEVV